MDKHDFKHWLRENSLDNYQMDAPKFVYDLYNYDVLLSMNEIFTLFGGGILSTDERKSVLGYINDKKAKIISIINTNTIEIHTQYSHYKSSDYFKSANEVVYWSYYYNIPL